MITRPETLVSYFNEKFPGAYRQITIQDVRDMTTCGLIGRYRYYSTTQDGETIRGILQYEQLRGKRSIQQAKDARYDLPKCKMCGQSLPPEPEGKTGRPKEYCSECESLKNKDRQRKFRRRRRKHWKVSIS